MKQSVIKCQDLAYLHPRPAWQQKAKSNTLQELLCINEKPQPPGANVIKSVKMWGFKDVAKERTMLGFFQAKMCGLTGFLFYFFFIS